MQTILSILNEVRDPRDFNARHDLGSILFIALAATLCGAKTCVDYADFGAANEEMLAEIVDLPHGAPSHDCFSRIFRLLDADEVSAALTRFCQAVRTALNVGPPKGVVAVDGKRLRGAYERGRSFMPPVMVSVWDAETRVSIAGGLAPGGNEIAGTLAVLKAITLKGCIVTADALYCNPATAQAVKATGADYALGLKSNHGPLYAAAVEVFAEADARGHLPLFETTDRGHDREEWRCANVIKHPPGTATLPGMVAIGRIESERRYGGKIETATRYIALSTILTPQRLLEVVRAHWSVENDLHWQLDVSFHEDNARTRKDNAPQNIAVIRRMALDILRAHPDKRSIARKMNLARWRKSFFYELFAYMQ